jgi:hypothetical protein
MGNRKPKLTAVRIRCADHTTASIRQKLALTSPTSGGRSVGIVRLRTEAMEFVLFVGNRDAVTEVSSETFTSLRIILCLLLIRK